MVALKIGIAADNDCDEVCVTLQAVRLFQDVDDTELLVVANCSPGPSSKGGPRGAPS